MPFNISVNIVNVLSRSPLPEMACEVLTHASIEGETLVGGSWKVNQERVRGSEDQRYLHRMKLLLKVDHLDRL